LLYLTSLPFFCDIRRLIFVILRVHLCAQIRRTGVPSNMFLAMVNKLSDWFLHHQALSGYLEPVIQRFKPAWRTNLYRAQVMSIEVKTGNYVSLVLKPQRQWPSHVAGQHIELTVELNGRLLTRIFTVASSPDYFKQHQRIILLIKCNELGRFTAPLTTYVADNDWVNISAARGEFVANDLKKPIVMVAGGSGITPMIAMLSQHLPEINEPVYLRYIASPSYHQFTTQLTQLAATHSHFSFDLMTRLEHQQQDLILDKNPDVYCCGPAGLMDSIEKIALNASCHYYHERFSLMPVLDQKKIDFKVVINGNSLNITNKENLLVQLEQQQAPVTRGCGIGVCHQCQCYKTRGLVKNLRTGEVSDNGESLIQLCISQPLSDLEISV